MTAMRQTPLLLRFVVVLFGFVAVSAHAQNANANAALEKREAQVWLKKIQYAGQRLNYSGTFVYQQGNQMRTSRITHLLEGRNEAEKLEVLDGKPREYIRNNDEIMCYVPDTKTVLVEKRVLHDVFPSILAASPVELEEHYHLARGEDGRVAGHDCQSVTLEPKDNLRYGYKLWAEKSSGLLLRAQTLNEKREVIEQIAFTQIAIGNVDRNAVKASVSNTSGWHVEKAVMSQAQLSGWVVKSIPAGFKKIHELKRMVSDSANTQANRREVAQIVYSDGLAAISIFIEPGSQSRTEGSMQQGAMNIIGKRYGDFWLTVVGEVPGPAIKQVANSIEYKPK